MKSIYPDNSASHVHLMGYPYPYGLDAIHPHPCGLDQGRPPSNPKCGLVKPSMVKIVLINIICYGVIYPIYSRVPITSLSTYFSNSYALSSYIIITTYSKLYTAPSCFWASSP
ncbi:uncharacterized protein P174DRAFT_427699 [Aspergillus novofumigatus IBT 16806]|uniref:Uncharacterized protein n=1 Tax=Aspergillus novofumigatus (strain IBT 16806) TaxID=1392255 RepID=A0A2I1CPH9_ASPN1|nr:uncharacterized protein P174DRAFT_427699 [Aspergillus novofumigatus IBT 16806]PKX99525.1 hypothetical protein P174DRAFT_427699 [Aspergillus novofumigatus IBT 16806]